MSDNNKHLDAAVEALGRIMLEMQRRRLLSDPKTNRKTGEMLANDPRKLTDEQIGRIAADAFEAGATELARLGHPGAAVFNCNLSEDKK